MKLADLIRGVSVHRRLMVITAATTFLCLTAVAAFGWMTMDILARRQVTELKEPKPVSSGSTITIVSSPAASLSQPVPNPPSAAAGGSRRPAASPAETCNRPSFFQWAYAPSADLTNKAESALRETGLIGFTVKSSRFGEDLVDPCTRSRSFHLFEESVIVELALAEPGASADLDQLESQIRGAVAPLLHAPQKVITLRVMNQGGVTERKVL